MVLEEAKHIFFFFFVFVFFSAVALFCIRGALADPTARCPSF